ncbi:MAG: TRAP transporter substrate-binding protein DctP [Anaerovoracaceae bacterium]|jgi:TRAP-type C4-dicarboxylate transport system substrate-binding protein
MSQKKIIALLMVLALILSSFAGCGGGGGGKTVEYSAENPLVLRLASDAPAEHIATGLNNDACAMVEERTEGRVKVQYFPASQLGDYNTVYEEIVRGTIDLAQITIPESIDPRLGAPYLPYYALNYDEVRTLFAPDSFMCQELGKLTAETNVRFLGIVLEGFIGQGYVKEPTDIFTPGTNKYVKSRSPSMVTFYQPMDDLGFGPVSIPYGEVPTAIQTNVVDGWVGGTPNMNYAWVGELINYMYVNYIHAEATSYVMSELSLSKLTPEDQEIVIGVFEEQSLKSFTEAEANEKLYMQKLADDYGVEVIEFTQEQIQVYADFVRENSWPAMEDLLTKELMDGFRKEIGLL